MNQDYTADEIIRLNTHPLTAHQLVTARRERHEAFARWEAERASLVANIEHAARIGVRVLAAHKKGRKTVRIADLLDADGAR